MNTKRNDNFSILGPEMQQKKGWKYVLYLNECMDYNEVWFYRSTFHEKKPRKNLQGDLFS